VRSGLPERDSRTGPPPRALVEAWRARSLDERRVERAYFRFARKARAEVPRVRPGVARWVVLGVAIGIGSVYAAPKALDLLESMNPVGRRAAVQPPSVVVAPPVAAPSSRIAPPAETPSATPKVLTPEQPPPAVPAEPAASDERWTRAARGLRERDFDTASAALEDLARRGSRVERESALLVQAQLFLVQSRQPEALSLLRTLAATAESSSVRQKAAELLARANTNPSARSFEPAAGTNGR
jgi:hypothetical protein